MTADKRRIAIISGSLNDLWQMIEGMEFLEKMKKKGKCEIMGIDPASQHRRPLTVQSILTEYARMPKGKRPHFIITTAGCANHLSGCSDAFLRFTLAEESIVVIAVAIKDPENEENTESAIKSTTRVPGKQLICKDQDGNDLVGGKSFLWACVYAATTEIIPQVFAKEPPPYERLTLTGALKEGKRQLKDRIQKGKPID